MNSRSAIISFITLIPRDHLVRLVNEAIDQMGIEQLLRKYQAGGGAGWEPEARFQDAARFPGDPETDRFYLYFQGILTNIEICGNTL